MTVRVRTPVVSVSPPAATRFTDDFATDRDRTLYHNLGYGNTPGGMVQTITGGLMRISGGSTSGSCGWLCTGAPGLQGKATQYIQATLVSAPVALNRTGIAVKVSGNGIAGVNVSEMFAVFTHMFTGTLNVLGTFPSAIASNYAIALAVGAPALNDIFELEVQCGAASNRVRFWQNGTLLADVADADANRVVTAFGWPGWAGGGSGTAIAIDWDDLVVGLLRP